MGFPKALAKRPADAHTHVQKATRAGVHPIVAGMTRELSENVVDRDGRVPEAPHFLAELAEVRASPIIEVQTYGPYADGKLSKPAHLLRNPNHALRVLVGKKSVTVIDNAHAEFKKNLDGGRVEGVPWGDPHLGIDGVVMKYADRVPEFDLLHFRGQARKLAASHSPVHSGILGEIAVLIAVQADRPSTLLP